MSSKFRYTSELALPDSRPTTPTYSMERSTKEQSKRERKRLGGVLYSTQLLRRKRVETQILALEAQTLSAQLEELQVRATRRQRIDNVTTAASSSSTSQWGKVAAIERERRVRAEKINRQLKVLLAEQTKLRVPILNTLEKTKALQEMEFVLQLRPAIERPLPQRNLSETVLEEMTSGLDWLRLDTDAMLSAADDYNSQFSFRWQHMPLRNCSQSTSLTSVTCAAQEVADMLWRHITDTKKANDKSYRYVRRKTPTPLDMTAVASMFDGLLCSNAVAAFRKYDEGDRIILVGATKWFLPTGELALRDYSWDVISPSPGRPLGACVMRICYKLEMATAYSGEATRAQEMAFHAVSGKMRNFTRRYKTDYSTTIVTAKSEPSDKFSTRTRDGHVS